MQATLLLYTGIPALLMAIGAIVAWYKQPSDNASSMIQHFAAGVVLAAVAAELVPKIIQNEIQWLVVLGFAVGVLVMFATEAFARCLNKNAKENAFPAGLVLAVIIDVFIDGLLIGVAFSASARSGIIIALALTLEVFFLSIATTASLIKRKAKKSTGILCMLFSAILIPIGTWIGFIVASDLPKTLHMAILAFGTAALLYLVVEELLIEAHEVPETRKATLAFFVGFLIILLIP